MSHLVLLSVGDEATAREGYAKLLSLHAVALLTLQGCALLGSAAENRAVLIATPPDEVGVQRVEVTPAFAGLVESLMHVESAEASQNGAKLGNVAERTEILALLDRGEYVLVFLASAIAESEVERQLSFVNGQYVSLTLSDSALARFEPGEK